VAGPLVIKSQRDVVRGDHEEAATTSPALAVGVTAFHRRAVAVCAACQRVFVHLGTGEGPLERMRCPQLDRTDASLVQ
jgi:hypothetical protein